MERTIRPFAARELQELALLAQRLNAQRETGSTFCCARTEDIQRDFEAAIEYGYACWAGERPLGLISCFPDWEKGNADCSLLIDAGGRAYREIAEKLAASVRKKLGPEMSCTFFFPKENGDCRSFLDKAGAQRQENEYLLRLKKTDWVPFQNPAVEPRPAADGEQAAFAALHDAIFPGVYVSGKDIWADLGKTRFVFVIPDGAGLAAYGVLKTSGGRQATAEIVGVREDVRRRGYGRAMLNFLAQEAFSRFNAEVLDLVVDADNQNALKLYIDTGFSVWQENNCYILR